MKYVVYSKRKIEKEDKYREEMKFENREAAAIYEDVLKSLDFDTKVEEEEE